MGMGILLTNYEFRLLKLTESKELSGVPRVLQVLQWIVNRARVPWECSRQQRVSGPHGANQEDEK